MNPIDLKRALAGAFALAGIAALSPAPQASAATGDILNDGTVSAGTQTLLTTAADAPTLLMWDGAKQYCDELTDGGNEDWALPTPLQLDRIFQASDKGALKGTFTMTGSPYAVWYWSSDGHGSGLKSAQNFSSGKQDFIFKGHVASTRCVRTQGPG